MAAAAKNSIEGKAEPYLKRIENLLSDLDSMRSKYMSECKEVREDVKEVYQEAKSNGVLVKALRGIVQYRELERKQDAISAGLDIDEASAFEQLVEALGPLGKAAAAKAGYATGEDDKDVRPRHAQTREAERADEAALNKVGKGAAADSITDPVH